MRLSFPHPYWYEVGMLKVPAVDTPSPEGRSRVAEKIMYRAYCINSGASKEKRRGV